jgi:class 3 adenylate cyclase
VTFLFTDIEGSTRRWEADADAMRAALMEHDEVLRSAIEAYDGFLFGHTGDGVVAAFASPTSAANAADPAAVPDAVAAVLFITQQTGQESGGDRR